MIISTLKRSLAIAKGNSIAGAIAAAAFALTIPIGSTLAIQLADGTISFAKPPRLIDTVTTFNSVRVSTAKYYFTLDLPDTAGEPLQKVTINQRQGTEDIKFRIEQTFAFEGTNRDKGTTLSLQAADYDEETKTISVIFDPPIPPGTTFSVGLKPKENPRFSGVYLFGVTAFPAGEKPRGLYLGAGRLQFYSGSNGY